MSAVNQHKRMAMGQAVPQGKGKVQLAKGGIFKGRETKAEEKAEGCACGGMTKKKGGKK